ncbi:putative amidase [Sesamum alatum]|uniref:Amidase n=1 Tax=Sesamum alatum TaxID=300844 RepID=A0AAE1YVR7_9LAMI|nr:putative amidase [Sesamum alatum]
MDWSKKLFFTAFLIVAAAIHGAHGDAMVTGTVFCDQCKDDQISLFDYPLYGVKVTMACPGSDGQFTTWGEETTNWVGNYAMRFEGTPNLSGCYTQVLGNGQGSNGCGAVAGPPKHLRLMFDMFDTAMYTVDPLLAQPGQPMSFCSNAAPPNPVSPSNPPPVMPPPAPQQPVPQLPPMPPAPFLEASACPYQQWMMPEHRCYWKVVTPDTKVAVVFGLIAAHKYGTDMTLWQGMRGRGDPYRTLLREATTALLNSYNSVQFPYHPLGVIQHMNWALMGSTRHVLHTALSFMRANSGTGTNATCRFTSCKSDHQGRTARIHREEAHLPPLVDYYLNRIESLNPELRSVIEVNPDAVHQADRADIEREGNNGSRPALHGIPVLLKDSIATRDKLNTTAGSYALLGAVAPRDAGVVQRLRNAGAVILGKASMSEWYNFRSLGIPNGWCARAGQGVNPYVKGGDPCGSSSGSAISVAANMVMVSLGTETDGSLICPGDHNSVVALKPTVGLTSRAGVIPMSPRQDTVGPVCRTVSDAVYVLDSIVGFDPRDSEATKAAAKFIPLGGYTQFLNEDGLKGKRLGVVKHPFLALSRISVSSPVFEGHLQTLREKGAIILDNLEIPNIDVILNPLLCGEALALMAEFKLTLNDYLREQITSPVRSLSDIINFNQNNPDLERNEEFGQDLLIAAESTNGIGEEERQAIEMMENLSRDGLEKLMLENALDAIVTLGSDASTVLAMGGFPAITVPAGYDSDGMPFGIFFGGLRGTEPTLIEIAYAFEQATLIRKPPPSISIDLAFV